MSVESILFLTYIFIFTDSIFVDTSKKRKDNDSCKHVFTCVVDVTLGWNTKAIMFSGPKGLVNGSIYPANQERTSLLLMPKVDLNKIFWVKRLHDGSSTQTNWDLPKP